jgi:hypothetical protein
MAASAVPFPAPVGFHWICTTQFRHWRSKKVIKAEDHGKKCFFLLVRGKRG